MTVKVTFNSEYQLFQMLYLLYTILQYVEAILKKTQTQITPHNYTTRKSTRQSTIHYNGKAKITKIINLEKIEKKCNLKYDETVSKSALERYSLALVQRT